MVIREEDTYLGNNSISCVADGYPGIYFQKSGNEVVLNSGEKKLSKLFLYGQTLDPITIDTVGDYTAIIVQFHPQAIKTLFGIDAHELTGTCMDHELLGFDRGELIDRLLEERDLEVQIGMIEEALQGLLYKVQPQTNPGIDYATKSIVDSGGVISLPTLQDELRISERTFQRQFLKYVGVSPSQYKMIIRFHRSLRALESNVYSLSQIAYDHGFSDQSHFIRVFKSFTGKTPTAYLAESGIGLEEERQ